MNKRMKKESERNLCVRTNWLDPQKNTKASYFEFAELIMALLNIEIYCIFSIFQQKKYLRSI